jgi:hypothetical protein
MDQSATIYWQLSERCHAGIHPGACNFILVVGFADWLAADGGIDPHQATRLIRELINC